ncbi:MAG: hypothetical protein ACR2Q3_15195, partial [Woeseiaceae bacterium]
MKIRKLMLLAPVVLLACATEAPFDPLIDYEEVDAATIIDAPTPANILPENAELVARGEYLVELLGCGACHTDGALIGEPDMRLS